MIFTASDVQARLPELENIEEQPMRHPLEPLAAAEVQQAVQLLKSLGKVTPTTRFVSVSLKEPDKARVHRFPDSGLVPREAFMVLFDNAANACHEATVSLAGNELLSWKTIPGAQPT